jgi:hypothetical protein
MASERTGINVLLWHVHGSWTEAFVAGRHTYWLPFTEEGDAFGRGLCGREWPNAREVSAAELAELEVDLVVVQREEELSLARLWLGRGPGLDVPAVYVEHNAPRPSPVDSRHPVADRDDIPVVHVSDFNRLMWDNGSAPTWVIDHGLADPGPLYSGKVPAGAVMINEPVRRWRRVGADLLEPLGRYVPLDVWGIGTDALNEAPHRRDGVTGRGDRPTRTVMAEVARRRLYLHTARWTSLGMSLLEAMFLGMPIVAVASTMAPLVIPGEAGVVSADIDQLGSAARTFVYDPAAAAAAGKAARDYALSRFGLERFLADWDRLIAQVCR